MSAFSHSSAMRTGTLSCKPFLVSDLVNWRPPEEVLSLIAACKPARGLVAVMCGYSPRGLMLLCTIYCDVCILWCVLISVKCRLTGCHCLHIQFSMKPCAAFKFPGFQKMPACHECKISRSGVTVTPPCKVDEEEDARQQAGSGSCQRLSVAQLATSSQVFVLYSATQSPARFQRLSVQKQSSHPGRGSLPRVFASFCCGALNRQASAAFAPLGDL